MDTILKTRAETFFFQHDPSRKRTKLVRGPQLHQSPSSVYSWSHTALAHLDKRLPGSRLGTSVMKLPPLAAVFHDLFFAFPWLIAFIWDVLL
jgi:hypothetical protein